MSPKPRKKEPPDPSPSLFDPLFGGCLPSARAKSLIYAEYSSRRDAYADLNLYLCRVPLLCSGRLFLPIPDLGLHVLEGTKSPVSVGICGWPNLRSREKPSALASIPNCLASPASLWLNLPACNWPVPFSSRFGRHPFAVSYGQLGGARLAVWRVMVLIKPKIGVVELVLEESISLFELSVRSAHYAAASPSPKPPSGLDCIMGKSAGVNVPIVQFVPALVRSRISISLGASILKVVLNGSRSVLVVSCCHNWKDRSVRIASCRSLVLNLAQVCYSLPLLFFIVLMDSFWTLFSNALQSLISQSCVYWTGVLSSAWPWNSLSLNWLGAIVLAVAEFWFRSLLIENSKLCRLFDWKVVSHVYELVLLQRRPAGSIGLLLSVFWISVTVICYTLRMLVVLISLALIRVSFLLPTLLERTLKYPTLFNFIFFCRWYPCNFNVELWVYCFLFGCFHLDQCVCVLGMRPRTLVLPCSVSWISLAWVALCIVYSGVLSRASLSCTCHSMLLSVVATMALVRCAQTHVCLVRLSTGLILMSLSSCLTTVWVKLTLSYGWLLTYMMRLPSSVTIAWIAVFEFWGLPLFWLSLPLERLSALRQEPLWSRFCWQLLAFQIGRDEATGKNLFVDEDLRSETSLVIYFDVPRGICRVAWCFLVQVLGPGTPGCCEGPSRLVVFMNSSSAPDSSVVSAQLLISCFIATYWSLDVLVNFSSQMVFQVMIVVDRAQCIDSHFVNCISGWCTPSVLRCISSVNRILEQHLCVLGLCLMALEVHPWMHSPAHYGCCLFRCCVLLHSLRSILVVMQTVRCALKSLITVCMEIFFASLWFTGYFTICLQ